MCTFAFTRIHSAMKPVCWYFIFLYFYQKQIKRRSQNTKYIFVHGYNLYIYELKSLSAYSLTKIILYKCLFNLNMKSLSSCRRKSTRSAAVCNIGGCVELQLHWSSLGSLPHGQCAVTLQKNKDPQKYLTILSFQTFPV